MEREKAMNLKGRLEKLEAEITSADEDQICVVLHGSDCKADREKAVGSFVSRHGFEPKKFMNILLCSAEDGLSVCGCQAEEVRPV